MKKIYLNIIKIIVAIIILIIIAKVFNINKFILEKIYPKKYEEYVEKYSKEYNLDPLLVYSIIKAESNFNENAKSRSEAKGLMQLMDKTANEVANKLNQKCIEEEIYSPEINIMFGTKYFSDLLKLYDNNILISLAAYNAGIGNVNDWIEQNVINKDGSNIENIPFKETNMYVRRIVNNYKMYNKIYKTKE